MASNGNGVQNPTSGAGAQAVTDPSDYKGKGKAPAAEDDDMKDAHDDEEEDDDEDDEDEDAADVCILTILPALPAFSLPRNPIAGPLY